MTISAMRRAGLIVLSTAVALVVCAVVPGVALAAPATADRVPLLHLVTLSGPGTSASAAGDAETRASLIDRQDSVLAAIGAPEPTYRWTTALNGFAVELTADQVSALEDDSDVVAIEANSVRSMAGRLTSAGIGGTRMASPRAAGGRGGAGVVIGVVDSGIDPESPLFADVPGLGPDATGFSGSCADGEEWPATACNRKLVGTGWWVAGFGEHRIRSSETLSARDAIGHGTQVASVAAGNSDVSVRMDGRSTGTFSGVAPRARVAAYKACWAAPDPVDDGCATADLVSAIDRATADGVDVLNVSTAGPSSVDTVERALLGAAEADIVVIGAAGNAGRSAVAGHPTPWVTTVGATRGSTLRGQVRIVGGPSVAGASRSRRGVGPVRLVLGSDVAAAGVRSREARECRPDSLDAKQVAGKAVVCVRGGIGRVDKSLAVSRADGVAMVLVNDRPSATLDDFHSIPTVQVAHAAGQRLVSWVRRHQRTSVRIAPLPADRSRASAARWSAPGDARSTLLKPDVVALGEGVLGAIPDSWALFSGTSAASARVSGLAALIRANHDWSASVVRSHLTTTATPVTGASTLSQGAGRVAASQQRPGLVLDVPVRDYRRALEGLSWRNLNVSSIMMRGGGTTTRRVTNVGARATYFSARVQGFAEHRVQVTPVALMLDPGESARVRITVTGRPGRLDDGWIVWRGARGTSTRIPVAITR